MLSVDPPKSLFAMHLEHQVGGSTKGKMGLVKNAMAAQ